MLNVSNCIINYLTAQIRARQSSILAQQTNISNTIVASNFSRVFFLQWNFWLYVCVCVNVVYYSVPVLFLFSNPSLKFNSIINTFSLLSLFLSAFSKIIFLHRAYFQTLQPSLHNIPSVSVRASINSAEFVNFGTYKCLKMKFVMHKLASLQLKNRKN